MSTEAASETLPRPARVAFPARFGGVAQRQSKRLIIAVSVVRFHPPLPPPPQRGTPDGAEPVEGRDGLPGLPLRGRCARRSASTRWRSVRATRATSPMGTTASRRRRSPPRSRSPADFWRCSLTRSSGRTRPSSTARRRSATGTRPLTPGDVLDCTPSIASITVRGRNEFLTTVVDCRFADSGRARRRVGVGHRLPGFRPAGRGARRGAGRAQHERLRLHRRRRAARHQPAVEPGHLRHVRRRVDRLQPAPLRPGVRWNRSRPRVRRSRTGCTPWGLVSRMLTAAAGGPERVADLQVRFSKPWPLGTTATFSGTVTRPSRTGSPPSRSRGPARTAERIPLWRRTRPGLNRQPGRGRPGTMQDGPGRGCEGGRGAGTLGALPSQWGSVPLSGASAHAGPDVGRNPALATRRVDEARTVTDGSSSTW